MAETNGCNVVSLSYPGALELWHQRLFSDSDTVNLPHTSFVESVSTIPSSDEIIVLIHKNILNTVFPAVVTVCTGRVKQSQEYSQSATILCLLYRSIDIDFVYLNLFVHNTSEIYPNLGIISHIRKYKSRETRMKRTKVILPPTVCNRTAVDYVDRENHVAFKDDSAVFSNFRSRLAGQHHDWQQVWNNFRFVKSNVSSELQIRLVTFIYVN